MDKELVPLQDLNVSCSVCYEELAELYPQGVEKWEAKHAALRQTNEWGLCASHTYVLGPALYRMVKAEGYVSDKD